MVETQVLNHKLGEKKSPSLEFSNRLLNSHKYSETTLKHNKPFRKMAHSLKFVIKWTRFYGKFYNFINKQTIFVFLLHVEITIDQTYSNLIINVLNFFDFGEIKLYNHKIHGWNTVERLGRMAIPPNTTLYQQKNILTSLVPKNNIQEQFHELQKLRKNSPYSIRWRTQT